MCNAQESVAFIKVLNMIQLSARVMILQVQKFYYVLKTQILPVSLLPAQQTSSLVYPIIKQCHNAGPQQYLLLGFPVWLCL